MINSWGDIDPQASIVVVFFGGRLGISPSLPKNLVMPFLRSTRRPICWCNTWSLLPYSRKFHHTLHMKSLHYCHSSIFNAQWCRYGSSCHYSSSSINRCTNLSWRQSRCKVRFRWWRKQFQVRGRLWTMCFWREVLFQTDSSWYKI